ncbi:MAG: zinc metalloprotease HtpX [Candidatus Colwellbacteria bacterium CG10_big_fil_rev_8_21_14_0_10_42_22]|uniref:Protease HtpX homolog n=1 Tax=Candidatus Colwellbacteria bacterium CG10_big_fil_rev_8_21_14_0_10_42_22 TaxID=1974540 RepID=A0A2H0VIG6_9BACT|nr:MAG: zinc metalloprotease HtpX [Candidatus Colwellbacteria bacterium CG10_big_fil_rev_8_21_14_0_10_42_22]
MASLYTEKSKNIRKTWILFSGFLIFVISVGWVFSQVYGDSTILYMAVFFSVMMSIISYWQSDKIVLKMHKAKEVTMKTNPELYRIVENLSITAGLPMPKVYIIPELAPNAFATGRNPEHAVVAVTEGLLQKLDRSELEGVLAHELSHVGNRDILVSTVAVVLVGFISLLADMFMRSMMFGGRRDNEGRGGGILILIGVAVAILAPISASLMQLAISRKRELLADSSGALLTRYPEGLASALQKISSDPTPMRSANNTTAHLWVADPFKGKKAMGFLHKLFLTHPPIEERIKALEGLKI